MGIVGREGLVGATHLLGPAVAPTECFIQLSGAALKIPFPKLQQIFLTTEEIRMRILEFVQEQTLSLSQLATCNRLHNAEERLARWLLMVEDCIQSDKINLTQEFLAQMLGVQRSTVTVAAGGRLIPAGTGMEYYRNVQLAPELEAAACDCYGVTKKLYSNLYKNSLIRRIDSVYDVDLIASI